MALHTPPFTDQVGRRVPLSLSSLSLLLSLSLVSSISESSESSESTQSSEPTAPPQPNPRALPLNTRQTIARVLVSMHHAAVLVRYERVLRGDA